LILELENAQTSLADTHDKLDSKSKALDFQVIMISSTVAHAAALFKNHLPDLNMELLRKDVIADNAEHETLVSSAFDVAQDFISSYDFASLVKSNGNDSPKALSFSSFACWMNWMKIDI
jgi:hypothetical protein